MSAPRAGRTVLVTGTTSGIGRALALELARRGHVVVATGRRDDALAQLAAEAEPLPGAVHTITLDVDDPSARASLATRAEAAAGRPIDTLVNNAGFSANGPLVLVTDAELERQFRTNVFGLHAVTRELLPALHRLPEGVRGRIINVSSEMGRVTLPFHGPYNASKHAVEALSNALRMELRPLGIDVVTVEPGITRTDFEATALGNLERSFGSDNPYSATFPRVRDAYRSFYDRGHSAERVARLIVRAIEARRPRARYVFLAGRAQVALDRMAPTWIGDRLKRRILGWSGPAAG